MSTNPNNLQNASGAGKRKLIIITVIVVILAVSVAAIWILNNSQTIAINPASVFKARRGPLNISVTESGSLQSRDEVKVKSKVSGGATILWIVADGTKVKKDDVLVRLDSSKQEDQKINQQITVNNAEAAQIRAREQLAIAKNQAKSDMEKAELDLRFAKMDLDKYINGEYPKLVRAKQADITIAKQEHTLALDKVEWSRKLKEKGYITLSEFQADELAAQRKKLTMEQAENELMVLQKYDYVRKLADLNSSVTQKGAALERTTRKIKGDVIQTEVDLRTKKSILGRQKKQLLQIEERITNCIITAPVDGMVVYATTGRNRYSNSQPLAEGQAVREGQDLINLPTTDSMKAEVAVHESNLTKVSVGMPVFITVDAIPGTIFHGTVAKIAHLPDSTRSWLNPDLKVYATEIHLDNGSEQLKPGMNCKVEMVVAEYEDAIYVPVQAVVNVKGHTVVYLSDAPNEPRQVTTGLDNGQVIRIIEGLSEGEQVLLNPPLDKSAVLVPTRPKVPKRKKSPAKATTQPTSRPAKETGKPGAATTKPKATVKIDMAKLKSMSKEEQKQWYENLSDEQKKAVRDQMRKQWQKSQKSGRRRPGAGRTGGHRR